MVTNKVVGTTILGGPSFNLQNSLKVLEKSHLLGVVLRVILDVLLMGFQVLNNTLLLSKFCIKEFRVRFELVCQPFLWLVEELGLVSNSLEESVVDLNLDVALMVLFLVLSVIVESGLNIRVDLFFLLV